MVRERLLAGDTNDEVRDYIVTRYGDFVLLNPPIKPETYILWATPPLAFLIALIAAIRWYARRGPKTQPAQLDEAEMAASDEILKNLDR